MFDGDLAVDVLGERQVETVDKQAVQYISKVVVEYMFTDTVASSPALQDGLTLHKPLVFVFFAVAAHDDGDTAIVELGPAGSTHHLQNFQIAVVNVLPLCAHSAKRRMSQRYEVQTTPEDGRSTPQTCSLSQSFVFLIITMRAGRLIWQGIALSKGLAGLVSKYGATHSHCQGRCRADHPDVAPQECVLCVLPILEMETCMVHGDSE